jgi:hypothetical protein
MENFSTPWTTSELSPSSLFYTTDGIKNSCKASIIDMTPIAEMLLPENGAVPGDRPHCELILTFPKTAEIDL